jgi:hypothetical protein
VQNYTTEYTEKVQLVFTKHFKICTTMNVDEVSNATHGKHTFFNNTYIRICKSKSHIQGYSK